MKLTHRSPGSLRRTASDPKQLLVRRVDESEQVNQQTPDQHNKQDHDQPEIGADFVALLGKFLAGVEARRATTCAELIDQYSSAMKSDRPQLIEVVL